MRRSVLAMFLAFCFAMTICPAHAADVPVALISDRTTQDHLIGPVHVTVVGFNAIKYQHPHTTRVVTNSPPPDLSSMLGLIQNALPVGPTQIATAPNRTALLTFSSNEACADAACFNSEIDKLQGGLASLEEQLKKLNKAVSDTIRDVAAESDTLDKKFQQASDVSMPVFRGAVDGVVSDELPKIHKLGSAIAEELANKDTVLKAECDSSSVVFQFSCVDKLQSDVRQVQDDIGRQAGSLRFVEYQGLQSRLALFAIAPFAKSGELGGKLVKAYELLAKLGESNLTDLDARAFAPDFSVQCSNGFGSSSETVTMLADNVFDSTKNLSKQVAVVDCRSPLVLSAGVGISTIPDQDFQLIPTATIANGAPSATYNVGYKVNSPSRTVGASFLHYDLGGFNTWIHVFPTVGIGTSKSGVDLLYGASIGLNRRIFFDVVEHYSSYSVLQNGYAVGQAVPSGLALPIGQQRTTKLAYLISIALK